MREQADLRGHRPSAISAVKITNLNFRLCHTHTRSDGRAAFALAGVFDFAAASSGNRLMRSGDSLGESPDQRVTTVSSPMTAVAVGNPQAPIAATYSGEKMTPPVLTRL